MLFAFAGDLNYFKLEIILRPGRRRQMTSGRLRPLRDGRFFASDPEKTMTEHSLWRFSRALHRAINERQFRDIAGLLDEDVEWAIHGPVGMFPFLGARRGSAAVLEVIRQIAENFTVRRFDRETIMLETDSAASMLRYPLTALDSGKPVLLRVAHFARFKAGRLTSIRALVDTFDLAEQVFGQPVQLPRMAALA
jgi:ketosteroid isomerase-like protein